MRSLLVDDDSLSKADLLGISIAAPCREPGVYFLFRGPRVIYVGQSIDVAARVACHLKDEMDFDRYSVLEIPEATEREELERRYLERLLPPLNRCYVVNALRSEEQQDEADREHRELVERRQRPL